MSLQWSGTRSIVDAACGHMHVGCGFVLGPAWASGVSRDMPAPCEDLSKEELRWQQLQGRGGCFPEGNPEAW